MRQGSAPGMRWIRPSKEVQIQQRTFVDNRGGKTSHQSAARGTIIAARLEPSIYAFLVEHMPTRKQPQILLWVIIFQTNEAL